MNRPINNAQSAAVARSAEITGQQCADAANAGLELLNLDTTLVPGNLRRRIALLELILQQVATGNAVIANPAAERLELTGDSPETPDEDPDNAPENPAE